MSEHKRERAKRTKLGKNRRINRSVPRGRNQINFFFFLGGGGLIKATGKFFASATQLLFLLLLFFPGEGGREGAVFFVHLLSCLLLVINDHCSIVVMGRHVLCEDVARQSCRSQKYKSDSLCA